MIEFHLREVLINNSVDLTGLYYVRETGDDVCISRVSGSCGGGYRENAELMELCPGSIIISLEDH